MTTTTVHPAAAPPAGRRDHLVERFRVTWAGATAAEPERLDRLTDLLVAGALDDALSNLGVGTDELVSIRRVAVPRHTVRWSDSDAVLVEGWSRSIAAAVEAAVRASTGDASLVRYPSRSHAVVDLVVRSAAGDDARLWAWSRLGLWPTAAPAGRALAGDVVARLLTVHPSLTPWAFVAVCRAGLLSSLLGLVGEARMVSVLQEAWAAAGGSELPASVRAAVVDPSSGSSIVARSSVAQAVLSAGGPSTVIEPTVIEPIAIEPSGHGDTEEPAAPLTLALAAVCVLEVEPSVAVERLGPATVAAVARLLSPVPGPVTSQPGGRIRAVESSTGYLAGQRTAAGAAPAAGAGMDRSWRGPQEPAFDDRAPVEDRPLIAGRGPARTQWGGLLFLLHLVDGPALAGAASTLPGAGGLRLLLYAAGREVAARAVPDAPLPDAADPALLAFAGLAAGSPPPAAELPAGTAVALLAAEVADALVAALRDRRHARPLAGAPDTALLLAVCRRRATVAADPGWIDVLLDLEEVSTEVRWAGLDLDLGFLPWLGCVVRFRYA